MDQGQKKHNDKKCAKDMTDYELGWEIIDIMEQQSPLTGGAHMASFAHEVRKLFNNLELT